MSAFRFGVTVSAVLAAVLLTAGCEPLGEKSMEYGAGEGYTAEDYKDIGKQIAQDTALNMVPGGEFVQFVAAMPEITKGYLTETFRARRDAAENEAILAHGKKADALDAESDYYDNYIRCLSGDKSACGQVGAKRDKLRKARAESFVKAAPGNGDREDGGSDGGGHSH